MPGHLGLLSNTLNTSICLIDGLPLLKYVDSHIVQDVKKTPPLSFGIVKNQKEITKGHYDGDQFEILIDGEIYGDQPQWPLFKSCAEVVSYLERVDGYFSAVIFCKAKNQINLFTDLFGIKPLYLLHNEQLLAWSSEIKTLVKYSQGHSSLQESSISAYMDLGFLPSNKTWYNDVTLLPAASITTIELNEVSHTTSRYWTWRDAETKSNSSLHSNLEYFGHLLQNAIAKRIFPNENTTIALSGGLDSRLLLDLIKNSDPLAFTFGHNHSDDVTIAQMVCDYLGIRHQFFNYTEDNWLQDKVGSIWRTEGMMPFFHLHSSPFCRAFNKLGDTVFNGFGGATLVGGLFVGKSEKIKQRLSQHVELDYDFYGKGNPEAIVIDQHMRRFINQGSIDVGKYLVQRTPFMDRELVLFLMSLPDSQRKHYRIFHKYLRGQWSQEFLRIPWENTNLNIHSGLLQELIFTAKWPTIRRIFKLGKPAFNYSKLVDYNFKDRMKGHYLGKDALIWNMLPPAKQQKYQKMIFKDLQVTGRLLSLEIWIRLTHGQLHADESIARF